MKTKAKLYKIIPNNQPLCVIEPIINDEREIVRLFPHRIIAWVIYASEGSVLSHAVGDEGEFDPGYMIYDTENHSWSTAFGATGTGLEALKKHFEKKIEIDGALQC